MKKYLYFLILLSTLLIVISGCSDNRQEELDTDFDPSREIAEDVEMIYSDSAVLEFTISTPRLEKYYEKNVLVEYFPEGLHIKFYAPDGTVISSMSSKYALRRSALGTMLLRDSVVLINADHDVLVTPAIKWDEGNHTLETQKFVQLIKSSSKDTLYGIGFTAKDDFSKFRISQAQGKRRYESLTEVE